MHCRPGIVCVILVVSIAAGNLMFAGAPEDDYLTPELRALVEWLKADAALDQRFEYVDLDDPAPGDYYYLRVTQIDGARAWTSPVWFGQPRSEGR
jgi:hypothetical protein